MRHLLRACCARLRPTLCDTPGGPTIWVQALVLADNRTVLISEDGETNGPLYRFVADRAGDLSAGGKDVAACLCMSQRLAGWFSFIYASSYPAVEC